jgi:hypothetical protein
MPDHHLSEDSATRSAEAFLRVADSTLTTRSRNLVGATPQSVAGCETPAVCEFRSELPRNPAQGRNQL